METDIFCKINASTRDGVHLISYMQKISYEKNFMVIGLLRARLCQMLGESYNCDVATFEYQGSPPLNYLAVHDYNGFESIVQALRIQFHSSDTLPFMELLVRLDPVKPKEAKQAISKHPTSETVSGDFGCSRIRGNDQDKSDENSYSAKFRKDLELSSRQIKDLTTSVSQMSSIVGNLKGIPAQVKKIESSAKQIGANCLKSTSEDVKEFMRKVHQTSSIVGSLKYAPAEIKRIEAVVKNIDMNFSARMKVVESAMEELLPRFDKLINALTNQRRLYIDSSGASNNPLTSYKPASNDRTAEIGFNEDTAQLNTSSQENSANPTFSGSVEENGDDTVLDKLGQVDAAKNSELNITKKEIDELCILIEEAEVVIPACNVSEAEIDAMTEEDEKNGDQLSDFSFVSIPEVVKNDKVIASETTDTSDTPEITEKPPTDYVFQKSLDFLQALGFTDEGGWLSRLLEVKKGCVTQVLRTIGADKHLKLPSSRQVLDEHGGTCSIAK